MPFRNPLDAHQERLVQEALGHDKARTLMLSVRKEEQVQPQLLLGILSGSRERRAVLRCSWMRIALPSVQILFIVGRNRSRSRRASTFLHGDTSQLHGDELRVPFPERVVLLTPESKRGHADALVTGSVSGFFKLAYFLVYSTKQTAPMIAIGDDDVFVQPRMLAAYAHLLLDSRPRGESTPFSEQHVYAGAFEYYSWRPQTLVASGWDRTADAALWKAQRRGCVGRKRDPSVPAAKADATSRVAALDGSDGGCIGHFAFAKGPLMLLSTAAARWVVDQSTDFKRDLAQGGQLAMGNRTGISKLPAGYGRIFQDVALGFWLRKHPTLQYVALRQYKAWCDSFKHVGDLGRLLVAHRTPWSQLRWLTALTERQWARASGLSMRRVCGGRPCVDCAHAIGQTSCAIDVALDRSNPSAEGCVRCRCWVSEPNISHSPGSKTRLVRNVTVHWSAPVGVSCSSYFFDRSVLPQLQQDCWRPTRSV